MTPTISKMARAAAGTKFEGYGWTLDMVIFTGLRALDPTISRTEGVSLASDLAGAAIRAAVEAIREPTEEMVQAGVPPLAAFDAAMSMQAARGYAPQATNTGWRDSPLSNSWRAMIDSILAEQEEGEGK